MASMEKMTPKPKDEEPSKSPRSILSRNSRCNWQRLQHHFMVDIQADIWTEVELVLLSFCTGMQDATTFPDYHCFTSNQTGNTVMLAMAVLGIGQDPFLFSAANVGVSLALFLAGVYVAGQIGYLLGPRRRLWIVLSNLIQTSLVFSAAAVQYRYGVVESGQQALGVIAPLALAAGSQVVLSRAFSMTEISTAMATAAWVDLLIDPELLSKENRARERRVSFLICLIAGAFVGALVYLRVGSSFALLLSGIGKLVVTIIFFFNNGKGRCRLDNLSV
jgi:uncharacterized membrane protein YoaK (UPF0700 family)